VQNEKEIKGHLGRADRKPGHCGNLPEWLPRGSPFVLSRPRTCRGMRATPKVGSRSGIERGWTKNRSVPFSFNKKLTNKYLETRLKVVIMLKLTNY